MRSKLFLIVIIATSIIMVGCISSSRLIADEQATCLKVVAEQFCEERNGTFEKLLSQYPSERNYSYFYCRDEWRQAISVPFTEEEMEGCEG